MIQVVYLLDHAPLAKWPVGQSVPSSHTENKLFFFHLDLELRLLSGVGLHERRGRTL